MDLKILKTIPTLQKLHSLQEARELYAHLNQIEAVCVCGLLTRRVSNYVEAHQFFKQNAPLPLPSRFKLGDTVELLRPHPQNGTRGKVIGFEVLGLLVHLGPRPCVQLVDGRECFLVRDCEARLVDVQK